GLTVTIADTAGLRESGDVVESIGVERAREAAAHADIILYLIDATAGLTDEDRRELARWPSALLVYTKVDAAAAPDGTIGISAIADRGVDALLGKLDVIVRDSFVASE